MGSEAEQVPWLLLVAVFFRALTSVGTCAMLLDFLARWDGHSDDLTACSEV